MMIAMTKQRFDSESTLQQYGEQLAARLTAPSVVYLRGELGAGKTTLVRGILRGLGYHGKVKSPTYTLVESYQLKSQTVYHFDLYRLNDPEELEHMGFRDYLQDAAIILIEWPEKAEGFLPPLDLEITITIDKDDRLVALKSQSIRY